MAFYGWPFSQCQSLHISTQLASGIRVIDIRLALIDGVLIAYHGSVSQRVPFQSILSDVHAFLASPTSSLETIIMSIKQEDWATTPPPTFSLAVRDEIAKGPGGRGMWYLENRIPTIAEVRGKVVMLSRFGGAGDGWKNGLEGMGLHIGPWPDSRKEGFTWWCKDTLVRVHDW
jgi:1-phosphatidylinositol phosphodiesterase